ncbi:MAG: hypothetical protein EOM54_13475, partial [Clostridia bacterium]|nr:hypothetical protein [Clostridia bacterium]
MAKISLAKVRKAAGIAEDKPRREAASAAVNASVKPRKISLEKITAAIQTSAAKETPQAKKAAFVDPAFSFANSVTQSMLARGPQEEIAKNAKLATARTGLEQAKKARTESLDASSYKAADEKAKSLQDTIDALNGKVKPTVKDVAEGVRDRTFGFMSGINKSVTSTLDFLLPTETLGKYDLISKANESATKNAEYFKSKNDASSEKFGKTWDIIGDIYETIGSAVPQAVAAILTGGASAAASTASLTSEATAGGLASTVYNSLAKMVKSPLYKTSFAQT